MYTTIITIIYQILLQNNTRTSVIMVGDTRLIEQASRTFDQDFRQISREQNWDKKYEMLMALDRRHGLNMKVTEKKIQAFEVPGAGGGQRFQVLVGTLGKTCSYVERIPTLPGGTFEEFIAQMRDLINECHDSRFMVAAMLDAHQTARTRKVYFAEGTWKDEELIAGDQPGFKSDGFGISLIRDEFRDIDFAHTTDDAIRKRIQNAHRAIYNAYRPVINSRMRGFLIRDGTTRRMECRQSGINNRIFHCEFFERWTKNNKKQIEIIKS